MRLFKLSCLVLITTIINVLYTSSLVVQSSILDYDNTDYMPTLTSELINLIKRTEEPTAITSKKKSDSDKDPTRVTTEIDVIYTTIIVETTAPLPVVYNMSDTGSASAHQQQQQQQQPIGVSSSSSPSAASNSPTDVNDPNKSANSVEDNLKKDKEALDRMIMILSLVGGLGVIAIVATLIIFTRMRARNRKQREIDAEDGNDGSSSTFELSNDASPINNNNRHVGGDGSSSSNHTRNSSSTSSTSDDGGPLIVPSAPPALLMIGGNSEYEDNDEQALISIKHAHQYQNRRNVISMSSQTTSAPSPSAPTAKELDAMIDSEAAAVANNSSNIGSSSSSNPSHHHIHQHQPTNCSRCATPSMLLLTSELPPPAYTPSAPPHYALPVEPIIIEPSRRHSLGG
jgi:hypothetical protein